MFGRIAACFRVFFIIALISAFSVSLPANPVSAAGALAVGKCGAYGQAFDYPAEQSARVAALKQCKGDCTAVIMKRACAALSLDMTKPCGAHGYAVAPRISSALNEATKKCYAFGGRECVSAPGPAMPKGNCGAIGRLPRLTPTNQLVDQLDGSSRISS